MKTGKALGIGLIALAILISISLPIIFAVNHALDFATGGDMAIYIIDKVIVSGFLIFIGISVIWGKWTYFISLPVISWTLAVQLLPLFNRLFGLLSYIESIRSWIWSINILLSLIILFIYVLFIFFLKMSSNKYKKVYEKVKSEEIQVQKTSSYLDDNGDLKGPGA